MLKTDNNKNKKPHGLLLHEWAWEFLRRNASYRALLSPYSSNNFSFDIQDNVQQINEVYDRLWDEFGLKYPVNPAVPGHQFPLGCWNIHLDTRAITTKPSTDAGTISIPCYPNNRIPREIQNAQFNKLLDKLNAPVQMQEVTADVVAKYSAYLKVYDLHQELSLANGGTQPSGANKKIALKLYPHRIDPNPRGSEEFVRSQYNAAKVLIAEYGYKDLLLTHPSSSERKIKSPLYVTEHFPPPQPEYLGSYIPRRADSGMESVTT